MAFTIPVYEERVGDTSAPGYRQSNSDPRPQALAQVGAAVQGAGETVQRWQSASAEIHRRELDEQNRAAVLKGYGELAEIKRQLLEDPQNGFLTQRGQNALTQSSGVPSYFQARTKQIRERLANDQQRFLFDKIAVEEGLSLRSVVDKHTATQSEVIKQEAAEGAIASARNDAALLAATGTYDQITKPVAATEAAVQALAQSQGWDAEFTRAQKAKAVTDLHVRVMNAMIDQGKVADADEYLHVVRDQLDVDTLAQSKIEKVLAAATMARTAQTLEQEAWAAAEGDPARAADYLREKGIEDTDLLDEAMQRVQQRGAAVNAARRQADSPRLGRIEQQILATGRFSRVSEDWVRLSDEGKADAMRMERAEQRSRRAEGSRARNEQRELDLLADSYFRNLAANDPEAASQLDVQRYFPEITQKQRNLIGERQGKLRQDMEKGRAVPRSEFMLAARTMAKARKLDQGKTAALLDHVSRAYDQWLEDPKNVSAKRPDQAWATETLGNAFLYGQRAGGVFDFLGDAGKPNIHRFELKPGERFERFPEPEDGEAAPAASTAPAPTAPTAGQTNRVVLVGPNGARRVADMTPELDAWLRGQDKWSVQR